jgi:hypothetical protein
VTAPWITEPGVYDIPAEDYHRDPVVGGSLSSSGARKLMAPSCPALFKAWRDAPADDHTEYFDVGKAAHAVVLGVGDPVEVIDARGWTTKAAREQRDAAYAAGRTPVLAAQWEAVQAMAARLREHDVAGPLMAPGAGRPEQAIVWRDKTSGVWCRALVDWLTWLIADYKTAADVDPDSVARAAAKYGYHKQLAWYVEGAQAVGLDVPDTALLVVQMKTAPYLVATYQLRPDDMGRGHEFNRKARDVYRACTAQDRWPGFVDARGACSDTDVLSISLPTWEQYAHDGAAQRGAFELEGASL